LAASQVVDRLAHAHKSVKKDLFAANQPYVAMLVGYFGATHYHQHPSYPDEYEWSVPLPETDVGTMTDRVKVCA
jgi:hypothetical protein